MIPALNEAAALPNTLQSLLAQTRPPDRVVVVDGGSADDTVPAARRLGPDVLTVPGRGRGGPVGTEDELGSRPAGEASRDD